MGAVWWIERTFSDLIGPLHVVVPGQELADDVPVGRRQGGELGRREVVLVGREPGEFGGRVGTKFGHPLADHDGARGQVRAPRLRAPALQFQYQTKVQHDDATLRCNQHVGGLEVAVDDVPAVQGQHAGD